MSGVDPFQEFVDEQRALRRSVEHLARTSLDKEEADALHGIVAKAVERMSKAAESAPEALRSALASDRDQIVRETHMAAAEAARLAVVSVKGELEVERRSYAESLADARREARRDRLRAWPIIVALLASGGVLGVAAAYGTETAKSVLSVRDTLRYGCDLLPINGQFWEQDSGWTFCAVPVEGPDGPVR